jgi:hypothetical protein
VTLPGGVLEYFWLVAAALMLGTAALVYRRARAMVGAGVVTEEERRRFALGLTGWGAGFCLAVQAVVWLTGERRIECLAALPPNAPASIATTALTLASLAALLVWVWRGRGAETLARFAPALLGVGASRDHAPGHVRRLVSGGVAIAIVGSVIASQLAPAPPDCRGRSAGSAVSPSL